MNNKIVIESLAMDLLRVSLGLQRGSLKMAKTFSREALKRNDEIDSTCVKPYLQKILSKATVALGDLTNQNVAEDSLLYSILLQNYCRKFL